MGTVNEGYVPGVFLELARLGPRCTQETAAGNVALPQRDEARDLRFRDVDLDVEERAAKREAVVRAVRAEWGDE